MVLYTVGTKLTISQSKLSVAHDSLHVCSWMCGIKLFNLGHMEEIFCSSFVTGVRVDNIGYCFFLLQITMIYLYMA